jgi:hypothetical protein
MTTLPLANETSAPASPAQAAIPTGARSFRAAHRHLDEEMPPLWVLLLLPIALLLLTMSQFARKLARAFRR